MKIIITIICLLAGVSIAQDFRPMPIMETSNVPTEKDATRFVTEFVITSPGNGLSATESVTAKTFFALGHDVEGLGKKGDRVWQVHFVEFGHTTRIFWLNAESKIMKEIYPENETKPNQSSEPTRTTPADEGKVE